MNILERYIVRAIQGCLWLWKKLLSPLLGQHCRFYPSCSEYASECFKEFGLIKGAYLSLRRVLRCNGLCAGGYDPVCESAKDAEVGEYYGDPVG